MRAVALGLRLGRWGGAGFSILAFIASFIQAVGFYQLAGHTPEQRAAFASSMTQLASQLNAAAAGARDQAKVRTLSTAVTDLANAQR